MVPFQNDAVIRPDSDGNYQCRHCLEFFACHEPLQFHATKHGETDNHIYIESKHSSTLKLDIRAFHDVYCNRSTHYVRVTISQLFGSTSSIQQIDEEVVFTFGEFREKDFISTEIYNGTLKKMEEFDSQCCRRIHNTTIFNLRSFMKSLRSCFSCIPTLRQFRPSRWPSTSGPRATSLYPSTDATTANDAHLPVSDDLPSIASQPVSWKSLGCSQDSATSAYSSPALSQTALVEPTSGPILASFYPSTGAATIKDAETPVAHDKASVLSQSTSSQSRRRSQDSARSAYSHSSSLPHFQKINVLPDNVTGVVAVGSFYSSTNGVYGNLLVATQSDTVKFLQGVHFGALLLRARIVGQIRDIVGETSYEKLLEFEKARKAIGFPVYSGILPDEFPTEVDKELRLEDCSPILQAEVYNSLAI